MHVCNYYIDSEVDTLTCMYSDNGHAHILFSMQMTFKRDNLVCVNILVYLSVNINIKSLSICNER